MFLKSRTRTEPFSRDYTFKDMATNKEWCSTAKGLGVIGLRNDDAQVMRITKVLW